MQPFMIKFQQNEDSDAVLIQLLNIRE